MNDLDKNYFFLFVLVASLILSNLTFWIIWQYRKNKGLNGFDLNNKIVYKRPTPDEKEIILQKTFPGKLKSRLFFIGCVVIVSLISLTFILLPPTISTKDVGFLALIIGICIGWLFINYFYYFNEWIDEFGSYFSHEVVYFAIIFFSSFICSFPVCFFIDCEIYNVIPLISIFWLTFVTLFLMTRFYKLLSFSLLFSEIINLGDKDFLKLNPLDESKQPDEKTNNWIFVKFPDDFFEVKTDALDQNNYIPVKLKIESFKKESLSQLVSIIISDKKVTRRIILENEANGEAITHEPCKVKEVVYNSSYKIGKIVNIGLSDKFFLPFNPNIPIENINNISDINILSNRFYIKK